MSTVPADPVRHPLHAARHGHGTVVAIMTGELEATVRSPE
jgi:hypothetical protein